MCGSKDECKNKTFLMHQLDLCYEMHTFKLLFVLNIQHHVMFGNCKQDWQST